MKFCTKCGAALSGGGQFCHRCGHELQRTSVPGWLLPSALGGLTVLALIAAIQLAQRDQPASAPQAPAASPLPTRGTSAPTDLSQMTPRQAVDRLYARVMRAAERGDTAEVRSFAPMTLGAYRLLGNLTADDRFHMGLVTLVAGDPRAALAHADTLAGISADHLFGEILRARAYTAMGQANRARAAYETFLARQQSELADGRDEYEHDRSMLDAFAEEARAALQSS